MNLAGGIQAGVGRGLACGSRGPQTLQESGPQQGHLWDSSRDSELQVGVTVLGALGGPPALHVGPRCYLIVARPPPNTGLKDYVQGQTCSALELHPKAIFA